MKTPYWQIMFLIKSGTTRKYNSLSQNIIWRYKFRALWKSIRIPFFWIFFKLDAENFFKYTDHLTLGFFIQIISYKTLSLETFCKDTAYLRLFDLSFYLRSWPRKNVKIICQKLSKIQFFGDILNLVLVVNSST